MKTFIKTIRTILSVSSIMIGLTALFTIDNAQNITSLIGFVIVMVTGTVGGIFLLISTYPELTDLSEFEESNSILKDYDDELESLRKDNLRLIKRISRLRGIILHNNIDLSDDDYEFVHNEVKINRLREKEIEI